jgi:trimeric autotransporter adhesin
MGLRLVRPRRLLTLTLLSCSALTTTAQTLTPISLSFGNWVVQTTSTPKAIVLKNTTTAPLAISSISVSGDFGQTSTCPIAPTTVAAGGSCKISVTFTPTVLGVRTGTLTVSDNATNTPQIAPLSGTGVIPVALSPSTSGFGNQLVNATSAAKVFTVQNNQTVPVIIAGISTSGDFAQTSNCPLSPNTLAAKLSCTISVTFTPTILGTRTGTLTVSDNAPNSPQTASLIGAGTVPVSLSPAGLIFASQGINTTSTGKSVTLKNTQTVPLTISGVFTSGDFAQTSTCPLSPNTLAAGATCAISVTFTPTALGTRTGTLTITDSASTSPQTASLSGTGTLSGLLSIFVAPTNPNLSIGNQQQFVATGVFSGGKTINISTFVIWSSSAPPVARVNATGLALAVAQGVATITAACGAVSGGTTITVATPYVTSITVIPDNTSVPVGAYEQFTAVLSYSDGSTEETTNLVSWSSSAATVATVTGSGLAHALAAGSATITASAESVTGSAPLVVIQPSCAAAPPGLVGWWTGDGNTVDIAGNNSGTLQNGATYGNGEVGQAFSFAGNGAAVLVNSPVYSPTAGTLMLWFMPTAAGSLTGSYDGTDRTPGLEVDANGNLSWEFGNLSAQPLGQIAFNQWSHAAMTYSSSNSEVAVNVYLNGNLAASAIASQNSSWYPQVGFGTYLGAQKPSFAGLMDEVTIFNQALSAQQIQQIYNAFSAGICKPTLQSIVVTPVSPSMAAGLSQQFTATGTYSDNSTQDLTGAANWNSSNPNVASVNSTGLASALTAGTTTISATVLSVSGSTTLTTVAPPPLQSISVTPANPSVAIGQNQQFVATGLYADGSTQDLTSSVSWSSSQPAIAAITTAGLASGLGGGSSTITAALGTISATATLSVNPLALVSIAVTPGNASIALGTNQQFAATGTYADGSTLDLTTSATWSSSAPSVATVNATGLATSTSAGQTIITAAAASIGGSSTLTVTPAALVSIAITPAIPSIALGTTEQFAATGTFTDGSTQNITGSVQWDSSDGSVATISNAASSQGMATSVATGSSSISATSGSISASTTLTVSIVALVSITVNPANPSIALGTTQQFTATGTFTDGSTQDLTTSATWGSSNTVAATVSSSALGTSLATGTATITATLGGTSGSTLLTVTPASVVSIAVSPATAAIPFGMNQTFTAVGTFTDGSKQDVTNSAHWSSSVPSVATVSNTSGSSGMATSTGSGSTVINATLGTVTGSGNLTVTTAILAAIEVNPQSPSISIGGSQQFTATGLYTDGSTANITTSVTWASSSATVATIGNTPGSLGLVTSASSGTTIISATSGTLAGSTSLAVQDSLVAISVFPPIATIVPGANQQYSATGTYASGLINDVSGSVLWSSSSPAVATITASGLAMSAANGETVISASLGSVVGSATLDVLVAPMPTNFRVDISDGTTGQLFVSWDSMNGAAYYNLQRSTNPSSGYTKVAACSGLANLKKTNTRGSMRACRDGGLTVGVFYYYQVQACYSTACSSFSPAASNVPVASDCTLAQIPNTGGVSTLPTISAPSSVVDPAIQFLPNAYQYASYASPAVPRRDLLVVHLPGSGGICQASAFDDTDSKLGFDTICVNYSNLSAQDSICSGDPDCYGKISQAKLDATGVCSTPGQSQCGKDPKTGQPYYLNNPADAVTQRLSMMLRYLNTHGYNKNGTNWGNYLSGTTPLWQNILMAGFSQGGDMSTFAAYQHVIARAINVSAPPTATLVNGIEIGATYLNSLPATDIRQIYGLVSVDDGYYQRGVYSAVWQALGFTEANNDAEVKLNTNTPIGLNCNAGTPSHNFSTSAPPGPDGSGHAATVFLWNEDIYKFMLID